MIISFSSRIGSRVDPELELELEVEVQLELEVQVFVIVPDVQETLPGVIDQLTA